MFKHCAQTQLTMDVRVAQLTADILHGEMLILKLQHAFELDLVHIVLVGCVAHSFQEKLVAPPALHHRTHIYTDTQALMINWHDHR